MFAPMLDAAYKAGACFPNFLGFWKSVNSSDGAWGAGDSSGNCIWSDPLTKPCNISAGECRPTEEHIESLTRASLHIYPKGEYSDFWRRMSINSTYCVNMVNQGAFRNMTHLQRGATAVMESYGLTSSINPETCSLYNMGQTSFMCRNNANCCLNNPAYTCSHQDLGQDSKCAGNGLIDAPCLANCPKVVMYPPDAACMGCAHPYVRADNEPYSSGAPADRFAPWYVGGRTGWGTIGGPYRGWTGCIPGECSDAAFSFDITTTLEPCKQMSPTQVNSQFPDPEERRKCALVAACGIDEFTNSDGLWNVHDELALQCDRFGEVATDSCVSSPVNLENPLCNAGQVVGQMWDAAVIAALAVVDGVIGTVGEMVYGRKFFIMWPTREINSLLVTAKNVIFSSVSILTALLYDVVEIFVIAISSTNGTAVHSTIPAVAFIHTPATKGTGMAYSPYTIMEEHPIGCPAGNIVGGKCTAWTGRYSWANISDLEEAFPDGIPGMHTSDNNKWARISDFCCMKDPHDVKKCLSPTPIDFPCEIFHTQKELITYCATAAGKADHYACHPTPWRPNLPICWGSYGDSPYVCVVHTQPAGADLNMNSPTWKPIGGEAVRITNGADVYADYLQPAAFCGPLGQSTASGGSEDFCLPKTGLPDSEIAGKMSGDNTAATWLFSFGEYASLREWIQGTASGKRQGSLRGAVVKSAETNTLCGGLPGTATEGKPTPNGQDPSTCHATGAMCRMTGINNLKMIEWLMQQGIAKAGACKECKGAFCTVRYVGAADASSKCAEGDRVALPWPYLKRNWPTSGFANTGVYGSYSTWKSFDHSPNALCLPDVYLRYMDDNGIDSKADQTYAFGRPLDQPHAQTVLPQNCSVPDIVIPCSMCGKPKTYGSRCSGQRGTGCNPGTMFHESDSNTGFCKRFSVYPYGSIASGQTWPPLPPGVSYGLPTSAYSKSAYLETIMPFYSNYTMEQMGWWKKLCIDPVVAAGSDAESYYMDRCTNLQAVLDQGAYLPTNFEPGNPEPLTVNDISLCRLICSCFPGTGYGDLLDLTGPTPPSTVWIPGSDGIYGGANFISPIPGFNYSQSVGCRPTRAQYNAEMSWVTTDTRSCSQNENFWGSNTCMYGRDESMFHDGCQCRYLPDVSEMHDRYMSGNVVAHGNENMWIKFDSFETLENFTLHNGAIVKHRSRRTGQEWVGQTPGAPLNTFYPTGFDLNATNGDLWGRMHALENLRYIGSVFTTFSSITIIFFDGCAQTLHMIVELLNALISPPYTADNKPAICNFADMGGSSSAPSPTSTVGGSGKRTVTPTQSGKIAQMVQCIGAAVGRWFQMVISHMITWYVGVLQSFQVLIEYWVTYQWRIVLPVELNGVAVQAWPYPIQGFGLAGKQNSYCNDASLFIHAKPPLPLCRMGNNVYQSGAVIRGNGGDNYNVTGHNGCACDCVRASACAFTDLLPYGCAHCMFEVLVDELIEVQFILDAILQIVYWLVMVILDALQLAFGDGNVEALDNALVNFISTLVGFISVIAKIAYNLMLQIPLIGPLIHWIIEVLVCDFIIDVVINQWYVVLYSEACLSLESICNHLSWTGIVSDDCGWNGAEACQAYPQPSCKSGVSMFSGNMTPASMATPCMPSWSTGGADMCRGVPGDASQATCKNGDGSLVFCECNPDIPGQAHLCCKTSNLQEPGVSEWTGACDAVGQQCICVNDAHPVSNPENKPTFSMCNMSADPGECVGWNCATSQCHEEGALCRMYTGTEVKDLSAPPVSCSKCSSPQMFRYCEGNTGICACRVMGPSYRQGQPCTLSPNNEPASCVNSAPSETMWYYLDTLQGPTTNVTNALHNQGGLPWYVSGNLSSTPLLLENLFLGPGAPETIYNKYPELRAFDVTKGTGSMCAVLGGKNQQVPTYSWIGGQPRACITVIRDLAVLDTISDFYNTHVNQAGAMNHYKGSYADGQFTRTRYNTFSSMGSMAEGTHANRDFRSCLAFGCEVSAESECVPPTSAAPSSLPSQSSWGSLYGAMGPAGALPLTNYSCVWSASQDGMTVFINCTTVFNVIPLPVTLGQGANVYANSPHLGAANEYVCGTTSMVPPPAYKVTCRCCEALGFRVNQSLSALCSYAGQTMSVTPMNCGVDNPYSCDVIDGRITPPFMVYAGAGSSYPYVVRSFTNVSAIPTPPSTCFSPEWAAADTTTNMDLSAIPCTFHPNISSDGRFVWGWPLINDIVWKTAPSSSCAVYTNGSVYQYQTPGYYNYSSVTIPGVNGTNSTNVTLSDFVETDPSIWVLVTWPHSRVDPAWDMKCRDNNGSVVYNGSVYYCSVQYPCESHPCESASAPVTTLPSSLCGTCVFYADLSIRGSYELGWPNTFSAGFSSVPSMFLPFGSSTYVNMTATYPCACVWGKEEHPNPNPVWRLWQMYEAAWIEVDDAIPNQPPVVSLVNGGFEKRCDMMGGSVYYSGTSMYSCTNGEVCASHCNITVEQNVGVIRGSYELGWPNTFSAGFSSVPPMFLPFGSSTYVNMTATYPCACVWGNERTSQHARVDGCGSLYEAAWIEVDEPIPNQPPVVSLVNGGS